MIIEISRTSDKPIGVPNVYEIDAHAIDIRHPSIKDASFYNRWLSEVTDIREECDRIYATRINTTPIKVVEINKEDFVDFLIAIGEECIVSKPSFVETDVAIEIYDSCRE